MILIFLNTRKYGGVSKNRMPTLMGVPFLKHPKNWRRKIRWVNCLPIKTGPLCL
jgi:hypothetical protein